jgi:hypothetical protein
LTTRAPTYSKAANDPRLNPCGGHVFGTVAAQETRQRRLPACRELDVCHPGPGPLAGPAGALPWRRRTVAVAGRQPGRRRARPGTGPDGRDRQHSCGRTVTGPGEADDVAYTDQRVGHGPQFRLTPTGSSVEDGSPGKNARPSRHVRIARFHATWPTLDFVTIREPEEPEVVSAGAATQRGGGIECDPER